MKKLNNMTRHDYFRDRLLKLGVCDEDSDYNGMIGKSVEALSSLFSTQGHSGCSAEITLDLFNTLMNEWKNGEAFKVKENVG